MNELIVTGQITSALTHFAMMGIAGILERDPSVEASVAWDDQPEPRARILCDLAPLDVAERIKAHAERHTDASSWVQRRVETGPRSGVGLFTARVKAPAPDEWRGYLGDREAARAES